MGLIIQNKLKWSHGRVPYAFDGTSFNSRNNAQERAEKAGVQEAIKEWNKPEHNLAVTLVPRKHEPDFILFTNNPVTTSGGSNTGNYHGLQIIWVHRRTEQSDDDITANVKSLMLHEIGHALGLYHEQNRHDRDDHVEVHLDNVHHLYRSQFKIEKKGEDFGPYDFDSIMQYGPKDYAIDDSMPTLTSKDSNHPIVKNDTLSVGDIDAVRHIYGGAVSVSAIVGNLLQTLKQFTASGAGGSPKAKAAIDAAVKAATAAAAKAKSDAEKAAQEAADAAEKAAQAAAAQAEADAAAAKAAADAAAAKAVQATADALSHLPHPHF